MLIVFLYIYYLNIYDLEGNLFLGGGGKKLATHVLKILAKRNTADIGN